MPREGVRFAACVWLVALAISPSAGIVGQPRPAVASQTGPAPGQFLVASRRLQDPNFRETVVLLVEHGRRSGAIGLVINRPSTVELFRVIPNVDGVEQLEDHLFVGGPVDPGRITVLLRAESEPEDADEVFENVYRSESLDLLERLAVSLRPEESFRAYGGYAGWAPGQLEAEVAAGGWHVIPGSVEAIFDQPSDRVWPELILRGTADWAFRPQSESSGSAWEVR